MSTRFESVQALRGVACLLVVVYHVAAAEAGYGLWFSPLRPALWVSFAGVDLFFVLSGFIIATTCRTDLGKPGRLPGYAFRRAWRIFPVYWAALVVAVVTYAACSTDPLVRPGWPAELLNTVFLLPQQPTPRILPVAWSLSYELMFYAGFVALFLLPRPLAPFVLTGWALTVVGCLVTGYRPAGRFAALAVHPFVLEFLAGCLVAWLPIRLTRRAGGWVLAGAVGWCLIGLLVAAGPDPSHLATRYWRVPVFGVPAALVVLAFTGMERGGVRVRCGRLSAIGDASYSIYLVHVPMLVATAYLTTRAGMSHTRVPHCAWLVLMFAAGVVPGRLFHRYVEAPLVGFGKRSRVALPPPEATGPRLAA